MQGLFSITSKGCSTPGQYGNNCSERCPENCKEGRCYITNGTCLGCTPGWIGEYCTESKNWLSFMIVSRLLTYTVFIHCKVFNTQCVTMDIMVWSAVKYVMGIVRTTRLVITSMVLVKKDAMMDGLEKSVTQVDKFNKTPFST